MADVASRFSLRRTSAGRGGESLASKFFATIGERYAQGKLAVKGSLCRISRDKYIVRLKIEPRMLCWDVIRDQESFADLDVVLQKAGLQGYPRLSNVMLSELESDAQLKCLQNWFTAVLTRWQQNESSSTFATLLQPLLERFGQLNKGPSPLHRKQVGVSSERQGAVGAAFEAFMFDHGGSFASLFTGHCTFSAARQRVEKQISNRRRNSDVYAPGSRNGNVLAHMKPRPMSQSVDCKSVDCSAGMQVKAPPMRRAMSLNNTHEREGVVASAVPSRLLRSMSLNCSPLHKLALTRTRRRGSSRAIAAISFDPSSVKHERQNSVASTTFSVGSGMFHFRFTKARVDSRRNSLASFSSAGMGLSLSDTEIDSYDDDLMSYFDGSDLDDTDSQVSLSTSFARPPQRSCWIENFMLAVGPDGDLDGSARLSCNGSLDEAMDAISPVSVPDSPKLFHEFSRANTEYTTALLTRVAATLDRLV